MEEDMETPEKLFNWKYFVFVGMHTLNFTLFYAAFPVVPIFAVSIGLSLNIAGLISGGMALASLFARPLSGYCNDHYPLVL